MKKAVKVVLKIRLWDLFWCFLITPTVLLGVEAICGVTKIGHSETLIVCPLKYNVNLTKHDVVVVRFQGNARKESVLSCMWTSQACPRCKSDVGLVLVGDMTRQVVARTSSAFVRTESVYRCQLVPPHYKDPYVDCQVITAFLDNQVTTVPTKTDPPKTTTPPTKDPQRCADACSSVVLAVLILAILTLLCVVILLINFVRSPVCKIIQETRRFRQNSPQPALETEAVEAEGLFVGDGEPDENSNGITMNSTM